MTTEEGSEAAVDPRIGSVLSDRYRVVRRIGEGGMGIVYEGLHLLIKRPVAIKMLHPEYSQNAEIRTRFRREAIAATTIRHPHIVEVLDMGQTDDRAAYMVLEYLEGRDWADDIEKIGPQPLGKAVRIVRQVCDGLQAAHDKNIVHRDLKAENVFLARHGSNPDWVKIVDFGISKILDDPDAPSQEQRRALTKTGAAMGTPNAMAPEQMMGAKDLDHRADLWALGVMFYRALTAHYPFEAETFPLLAIAVLTGEPPPLSRYRKDLPPAIQDVVGKLLMKDRVKRFQSAREVADALQPFEAHDAAPVLAQRDSFVHAATVTPATPADGAALEAAIEKARAAVAAANLDGGSPAPAPPAKTAPLGEVSAPAPAPAPAPRTSNAPATQLGHSTTPPATPAATSPATSAREPTPPSVEKASTPSGETRLPTPGSVPVIEPSRGGGGGGIWTGALLAVVLLGLGIGGTLVALHAMEPPPPPTTTATPPPSTTVEVPPPSSTTPAGPTVRLQISVTPESAELLLDGNPVPSPFDADIPSSTDHHTIEARADGYDTDTREVVVAFPMRVSIELVRTGSPHPHGHGTTAPTTTGTTGGASTTPHGTTTHDVPTTHVATTPPETHAEPPPPPPSTTAEPPPSTTTDRHPHGLSSPF